MNEYGTDLNGSDRLTEDEKCLREFDRMIKEQRDFERRINEHKKRS
jgi:hypothetical protein